MKMQKQPSHHQSINEFEPYLSNEQASSHSPFYQRIKQQVNSLILDPPDNFTITVFEQTKVRIVLRIKYFIQTSQNQDQKIGKLKSKKHSQKRMSHSNKVESIFMVEDQDNTNVKNFYDEKNQQIQQNYILFTCIIDYGIYPFSQPYLIMTQNIAISHDLTINNFSNITDQIMCHNNWFPSFTIEDLLRNIPDFVENLKQNQSTIKSSYYYEKPFRKLDIHQHALGLKIYEGETFDKKDAFIGKYVKKVIGISFKSLIFFKKDDTNGLKFCNVFPLNEAEKVKIDENDKRIKFTITFKKKLQISYKFTRQMDPKKVPQQIQLRQHFLNWMKLCLTHSMYENFKRKQVLSTQSYMNLKQNMNRKSSKISNAQNQQSIYNFAHGIEERDITVRKKEMEKCLIQKQQHLLEILETVDLLLSASIYRPYEKQHQEFEAIDFVEKEVNQEYSNIKLHNQFGRKSIETCKQSQIDLTKNQFFKLKHFKSVIQNELKQLFSIF